jgi:hypothetical protein
MTKLLVSGVDLDGGGSWLSPAGSVDQTPIRTCTGMAAVYHHFGQTAIGWK